MKSFFTGDKLIWAAAIFFIAWKFFLITLMWDGRNVFPPEPDDSAIYLSYINSVITCDSLVNCPPFDLQSYYGLIRLPYRLLIGLPAKVLGLTALEAYRYSFYIGTVLLVFVLVYFLRRLTNNPKLIAFSLFILALFHGAGSYHGFFWVVPSFFSVLLFFWLFAIILNKKARFWYFSLPILALISGLNHIMSIYAGGIFAAYAVLETLRQKKIDSRLWGKTLLTLGVLAGIYVYFNNLPNGNPYGLNKLAAAAQEKPLLDSTRIVAEENPPAATVVMIPTSPESATKTDSDSPKSESFLPAWEIFETRYLNWLFPHPLAWFIFAWVIFHLLFYRKYTLLLIWLSTLAFALVSLTNPHGGRALVYLWPVTYLLYAWGMFYGFKFAGEKDFLGHLKKPILTFYTIALSIFITINLTYSVLASLEMSQARNFSFPTELINFLEETDPQDIYCTTGVIGMFPTKHNSGGLKNICAQPQPAARYSLVLVEKQSPGPLTKLLNLLRNRPDEETILLDGKIRPGDKLKKQLGDVLIFEKID